MQIHVSQADGTPYYTQVVQQIKHLVASGRLTAGEQLPPVRKLAEQLLINPNTVARAYRELESAGVVVSKRGSGVFVSEGGSPLSQKEKQRILNGRIDTLLVEARQLGVGLEALQTMLAQRDKKMSKTRKTK